MSKHTPGPWFAREYASPEGRWYVRNADGVNVVTGPSLKDSGTAHLIASAPEMLEALRKAAAYIKDDIGQSGARMDYSDTDALNAINAAIAKAEGRT